MSNNDEAASQASSPTSHGSRASNIQKILVRKQKIFQWPKSSKIIKISTYSTCAVSFFSSLVLDFIRFSHSSNFFFCSLDRAQEKDCRCGGFKLSEEQRKRDESHYSPRDDDLCNNPNCKHPFRE